MKTEPLDAPFGARIALESDAPLDARERTELHRLFARHGLVVVRGGEISPEQQLDLLAGLGRVEPEPDGRPLLMEVTNQHARSAAPPGELAFHYDYAYDPSPVRAISMYGERVAEGATPTRFASSATVLER
ncbi:TauD/TfdA family dioxygenase, partial [Myxococcota bacterium]|nr:TauD/TfdA family dioxygenase [Myxococcota bacterium]